MPKLRICLLTDCYPPNIGGIESHVYALASQLGRLGHHVDVVTHQSVPPAASQQPAPADPPQPSTNLCPERSEGVVVHRLPGVIVRIQDADPILDPRIISKVQNRLRANDYDIVHGHSFGSLLALAGLRAARQLGMPTLITKHSIVLTLSRLSFVNRVLLEGALWVAEKWADGVIAVSAAAAQELAALDLPTYVIPGGVDCEHWHPDPVARKRIRSSLGYQKDHIVVGYLARLTRSKGAMSLLMVADRILPLLPQVRLLLIGDGPMRAQLQRQIEKLGLEGVVTLLGFKPWWETADYLNAMDIFASPSYREAFGLALVEAMACGIAAVARTNAGTRDIIADGETGYLIASDEEFFEKLLRLAEDEDLRKRMGANARRSVLEKYSWKAIAERTVEAYRDAIQRRMEHRA